ncbi:hypothetical protein DNU06_02990 [Putridiphycobacter roseus]|uniref:Fibronectin type-III domain-containing protein n=1 Tax=Putridiphycobacter roseus TaxID=2219161 RepID=A0A2W1NT38_9FLAO|nr:T9SS type A sorting domain-containing protein [Putridiphycobacter roseus]PZE18812.1 hypothetical protein DNU06_02990 [Putridiphycobacter roseus]
MKKIYFIFSMVFFGSITAFAQGETCATAVSVTSGLHSADGPSSGGGNSNVCFNGGTDADWYKFTPVCDGDLSIDNGLPQNPSAGIRLSVYSGDCATGLTCEYTSPGSVIYAANTTLSVVGGTTYYIEWDDSWINNSAPFDWTMDYQVSGGVTGVASNTQTNGAILSWSPNGTEAAWDIQYGPSGFNLGSGTTFTEDSIGGPYTILGGLLPNTTYDFYIAIAGTGCFVGPITFTTQPLCPAPTNLTTSPTSSSAILDWDLGATENAWDLQYGPIGTPLNDIGMLYNGSPSSSAFNALNLASCQDYHWYVRAVCTNFTPTLYSAWVGPVEFSTDCVCPEPSNLSAAPGVTAFDYNLSWTAGGTETAWDVQYGPQGFLINSAQALPIVSAPTNNPFLLTGLSPGTDYDYYVRAACGSTPDSLSDWVGPYAFTTDIFCPTPTGLGVSNITINSADISWNIDGSTTEWTLEWGAPGFTLGTGTNNTLLSNNAILTGLSVATEYCYYVKANCGATPDLTSAWAGPYCFTTLASCPSPSNLSVANVSFTSATLDWQPGASETSWDVEWGTAGFTIGSGSGSATVSGNSDYYATGLTVSAPYEFYVRANCGAPDGSSVWVGPFEFTTTLTNDLPCDAIELLVDGNVNVHTNLGATSTESAVSPPWAYAYGDNWYGSATAYPMQNTVWFKFKAPASGKVEISTVNSVTQAFNTSTEIALYTVGLCSNFATYNNLGANTWSTNTYRPATKGSKILSCDLNPGQYYYVMLDNFSNTSGTIGSGPGGFGISVTDIPTPSAGTATPISICGNGEAFDLFDAIDGYTSTSGTWYNPSALNAGFQVNGSNSVVSLPAGSSVYPFDYVIATSCGSDTISTTITTSFAPEAGMDGAFTTCNTDDVVLINHLNGQAQMGGTWSDVNDQVNVSNGIFHAYGKQYGSYNFYYIVSGDGSCPADTAVVTVTLTDNCLGLDDNASVNNLEVYPNPVNDVLTINNLVVEGNAVINVFDAQGKLVISSNVSNNNGNKTIDMSALDAGVYVVELTSEMNNQKVRVVKN